MPAFLNGFICTATIAVRRVAEREREKGMREQEGEIWRERETERHKGRDGERGDGVKME